MSNPGPASISTVNQTPLRGVQITAAQLANPTPEILANQTAVYQAPTGALYQSNGSSLAALGAGGGSGDMILASVQTVTGAKTFGTIGGAVGKLILAGSASGSTIVNAAATAGSTTMTLPGVTTTLLGASDVINDLTTGGTAVPLSAEQGKTLNTAKAALASPTFTGAPLAPTAAAATNNTQIATTAYADAAVAAQAIAGLASLNAADITSSRALASTDFGTGIIRLNAAGVIAITVPTVASMGLAATAGKLRVIAFEVLGGGIPTFAGATSSTSINGTAGTTTVLPLGGAPVTFQVLVLMQTAAGADTWTLQ